MKKILEVKRSCYPKKDKEFILWGYIETEKGCCYTQIFKGSRRKCLEKKLSYGKL